MSEDSDRARADLASSLANMQVLRAVIDPFEWTLELVSPEDAARFARIVIAAPEPGSEIETQTLRNLLTNVQMSRSLARVRLGATGDLDIEFDDGSSLRLPPGEAFEAWTLFGPDGEHVVSLPGGGLAWFHRSDATPEAPLE